MREALKRIPLPADPNLLVGYNSADDAGIYRISEEVALVLTVDFFAPIVDDPFDQGRVSAANALSDVYAMGGSPIAALNIVGFPEGELPPEILGEMLRGGAKVMEEAGVSVAGGHTVSDREVKYGLAVVGLIHPDRIVTNARAKPGDRLILTKPLGSGALSTALKMEKLESRDEAALVAVMTQLNRQASIKMLEHGAHACTDVTGYGLLGHGYELAQASGVTCEFDSASVPLMSGAIRFAGQGMRPGGGTRNRRFVGEDITYRASIDENIDYLLFDPQTSGGLLISISDDSAGALLEDLQATYPHSAIVGRVRERGETALVVR